MSKKEYTTELLKMKEPLIYKGSRSGRNRTRRENGAVFLNQRKPKRRFFKGFLAITNNEKQPRTTPVGVRVGVSVGVRKTSCIAPLSSRLSRRFKAERGMKMDIYCAFYDMDTNKVYAWQSDRNIVAIDCTVVENVEADNLYQKSELDYLIWNDPTAYADLILNGNPQKYLRAITSYRPDQLV